MKVIVCYGTGCDENTAWIPWLKSSLEKANIDCIVPSLPTPINQNYKTWKSILNGINIEKDDMVVGWSTGAIFAVRYLFENKKNIKKLITVSGFNNYVGTDPFVDNINKDFFMKDISVAKNVAKEIIGFKSNNDPFITQEALNNFTSALNARTINIENGGHFNAGAGYITFNELINEIMG